MFKVGNRVRVVGDGYHTVGKFMGKEGIVSGIKSDGPYNIRVKFYNPDRYANDEYSNFDEEELTLVEHEKEFNVGDKVRIVSDKVGDYSGKKGVITEAKDSSLFSFPFLVEVEDMGEYPSTMRLTGNEIRLLNPSEKLSDIEGEIEKAKNKLAQLENEKKELSKPSLPTAKGSVIKFSHALGEKPWYLAILSGENWRIIEQKYLELYMVTYTSEELARFDWELILDGNDL